MSASVATAPAPRWLSRKDTVRIYGISLSRVDELVRAGDFRAKKAGRKTLIQVTSIESWIEDLDDA